MPGEQVHVMTSVNERIHTKLLEYPDDVRALAEQAIDLAANHSEPAIAEQLEARIKRLVAAGVAE